MNKLSINLFLFIIFIVYFPIGVWAIFDSVLISKNFLSTSFANVVGLEIISDLGKSEIAGLYGAQYYSRLWCCWGRGSKWVSAWTTSGQTFSWCRPPRPNSSFSPIQVSHLTLGGRRDLDLDAKQVIPHPTVCGVVATPM